MVNKRAWPAQKSLGRPTAQVATSTSRFSCNCWCPSPPRRVDQESDQQFLDLPSSMNSDVVDEDDREHDNASRRFGVHNSLALTIDFLVNTTSLPLTATQRPRKDSVEEHNPGAEACQPMPWPAPMSSERPTAQRNFRTRIRPGSKNAEFAVG